MDTWNPAQYAKFKDERKKPFDDLITFIEPRKGMRLLDLGCGTGELTQFLHVILGASETTGIDNSGQMLKESAAFSAPGLIFQNQNIENLADAPSVDLIFSNAALQWVGSHFQLFGRLRRRLANGGQLAVQMPANHDHVSHLVAAEVAQEAPFREALKGYYRISPVLKPEEYASLLFSLGFKAQRVELRVYGHVLPTRDGVVEWVKGTLLTDYEQRMPPELFPKYIETYRKRLMTQLENEQPFFYPFKRVLLWAKL